MKKIGFISLATILLSTSAIAKNFDVCDFISGHWEGIYTIKNEDACKAYGGCTHLVVADLQKKKSRTFEIDLQPVVGVGGIFNLTCDHGIVTTDEMPNADIKLNCTDEKHCAVIFDDERIHSEMRRA